MNLCPNVAFSPSAATEISSLSGSTWRHTSGLLNTYKEDFVEKFSLLMHFPLVLVEVVTNRKLLSTPVTLLYKVLMVTFNMLNLLPV